MTYKPLAVEKYRKYIRMVNWNLEKGKIDWNLYDDKDNFICSIKISHGKKTKSEVVADSINKTKKAFEDRGLTWPPEKKKLKKS